MQKSIELNIQDVNKHINEACIRSKYQQDVTLIAVSKTKPAHYIEAAYDCGIRDFGENKVQELIEKYEILPKDIHWHFIGHLQTNKVKYIVDKVFLIHSVDSLKLANVINAEARKKGVISHVLIQVNISHEESKFGIDKDEIIPLLKGISQLDNVRVDGLMTIAPYTEDPETTRPIFNDLKQLSIDIDAQHIDNISMRFLSMGMSGDYRTAIEEGANLIRVGTNIFGYRDYSNLHK